MAIENRASRCSLQNQTVGIKTWIRTTEYYLIQQTSGISRTSEFAGVAFQNSTVRQDQENLAKIIGTKLWVFTRYVFTIPRIFRTNSKYTKRNKKEKLNMNSVIKRQNIKMIQFT
jgi:hypothetical protein